MSANTAAQKAAGAALKRDLLRIIALPPDEQEAAFDALWEKLTTAQLEVAIIALTAMAVKKRSQAPAQ